MTFLRKIARLTDPRCPVSRSVLGWIVATTLLLDQLTKMWALFVLKGRPAIECIPYFLQFQYRTNSGAAFSILEGQRVLLTGFSVVISLLILIWAWRLPPSERGLRTGLGLILGGAIGNLIDRVRLGEVIDFIDVHWLYMDPHWPTFNVADSAVCVGMGFFMVVSLRMPPSRPSPAAEKPLPGDRACKK
jgi:signal peptidase II